MPGEAQPGEQSVALAVGQARGGPLRLAADELVTGRTAVIGQSGSGKSYLAAVVCEELAAAGLPFVVVDPEGEYATLKEKFEVLHVGPREADVAFDALAMPKLAAAVLRAGVPVVLDVSEERERAGPFLQALFEAAQPGTTRPCLVVIEEASLFAPQTGERVEAVVELARRGRKRGLGILVATQRPAMVDKNVLSQCGSFLAGKLALPHDLRALRAMLPSEALKELPKLKTGEFLLIGNLAGEPGIVRFKARARHTSHKAATPKARAGAPSKALAEVIASIKRGAEQVVAEPEERVAGLPAGDGPAARVQRVAAARAEAPSKKVAEHLVARYALPQAQRVVERTVRRRFLLFGEPVERVAKARARWVQVHVVTLDFEEGRFTKRLRHRFIVVAPRRAVVLRRRFSGTWDYARFDGIARGHLLALEAMGGGRWNRWRLSPRRMSADEVAAKAGLSRSYTYRVMRDLLSWHLVDFQSSAGRYRLRRRSAVPRPRALLSDVRPAIARDEMDGRLEPDDEPLPSDVLMLVAGSRGSVREDKATWAPVYDFTLVDRKGRERTVQFDATRGRVWTKRFL